MGRTILKGICAVLLLGAFGVVYVIGKRAYWDYQVESQCKTDGGHTVFEVVEVSRPDYELFREAFGHYVIRPRKYSGAAPIVRESKVTTIHEGDPEVWRTEQSAVRLADGKVLAKYVSYTRRGGDLIALHPSSFLCPREPALPIEAVIKVKQ
jgi:hypothetical protein